MTQTTPNRNVDEVWDVDEVWEQCAAAVRSQVSEIVYQITFSSIRPSGIEDDEIVLTVPSSVTRDRIEGRYKNIIAETVAEATDDHLRPRIELRQAAEHDDELLGVVAFDPIGPATEQTIVTTPIDDLHLHQPADHRHQR